MNKVILIGRNTKDVELKSGKTEWATGSIAVNRSYDRDKTDFVTWKAFGKTAEIIARYVKKGDMFGIEGNIQTGKYEKDGTTVYTTDIIIERIELMSNGKKSEKQEKGYNDEEIEDEFPF
jgi:single-strand DNA-binding protein